MLEIVIEGQTTFNEETNEFLTEDAIVLHLEHSLVSLSKWESKFEKAFLGAGEKSHAEIIAYIKAMILDPEISPGVISRLTDKHVETIMSYLDLKQTATYIMPRPGKQNKEVVTSELIYYWMFANQVDVKCENWPLNRLITLLSVFGAKNEAASGKKQTMAEKREAGADRHRLNEERLAKLGTSG